MTTQTYYEIYAKNKEGKKISLGAFEGSEQTAKDFCMIIDNERGSPVADYERITKGHYMTLATNFSIEQVNKMLNSVSRNEMIKDLARQILKEDYKN